jgi:sugar phosphate isomerase/epimerase
MRGAAAACGFGREPHTAGVQLYTVRHLLLKHPLETLQAIADIGYREIEMLRSQVGVLTPYLKKVALRPVSLHFETPLLTGNWKAWQHADMPPVEPGVTFDDTVAVARDHGFQYLVFNYLAPEERLGLDFYRTLADKLNSAGLKCRSAGLRFCYHNHDFEFEPKLGGRPIDTLLAHLDKKLIGLEVDTFWVSMAGVDAAAFVRQNAGWVELVHLKDNIAISNHRLLAFDGERVTFRWRDYAHGNKSRLMTLDAVEFLRRFFLHVLPKGFVRIRHFGFLANRFRAERLSLCRQLLACGVSEPPLPSPASPSSWHCPRCGALMIILTRITPQEFSSRCTFFDSS